MCVQKTALRDYNVGDFHKKKQLMLFILQSFPIYVSSIQHISSIFSANIQYSQPNYCFGEMEHVHMISTDGCPDFDLIK